MNVRCRPLQTPFERKPTRRSPFEANWPSTMEVLQREARMLAASEVIIEIAAREDQIRLDGWPKANTFINEPGVAIWLIGTKHGDLRYATRSFDRWQDNVRAVALALEALRKVTRYGVGGRGEQYAGWKALPSGTTVEGSMTVEAASVLLWKAAEMTSGWDPRWYRDDGLRVQVVRRARARTHPDAPQGDHEAFVRVDEAAKVIERYA